VNSVNLDAKLATFKDHWQPRTIGQFNGHDELRDGNVELGPGELFVVPKGVEQRPVAKEEVHILLIEPAGTPNTGDPVTAAARRVI